MLACRRSPASPDLDFGKKGGSFPIDLPPRHRPSTGIPRCRREGGPCSRSSFFFIVTVGSDFIVELSAGRRPPPLYTCWFCVVLGYIGLHMGRGGRWPGLGFTSEHLGFCLGNDYWESWLVGSRVDTSDVWSGLLLLSPSGAWHCVCWGWQEAMCSSTTRAKQTKEQTMELRPRSPFLLYDDLTLPC